MFSLFELVWKRIRLFFTDDEVFYIGGADVLPPPLEREQENRCLIALSGLHGDSEPMTREDARKQLIEHNLRLVVYLARKFENTGICVEDLISIGTIGLIKGINTFNPEKKIINHVTGRFGRILLQRPFGSISRNSRTVTTADTGQGKHQAQTDVT